MFFFFWRFRLFFAHILHLLLLKIFWLNWIDCCYWNCCWILFLFLHFFFYCWNLNCWINCRLCVVRVSKIFFNIIIFANKFFLIVDIFSIFNNFFFKNDNNLQKKNLILWIFSNENKWNSYFFNLFLKFDIFWFERCRIRFQFS